MLSWGPEGAMYAPSSATPSWEAPCQQAAQEARGPVCGRAGPHASAGGDHCSAFARTRRPAGSRD